MELGFNKGRLHLMPSAVTEFCKQSLTDPCLDLVREITKRERKRKL